MEIAQLRNKVIEAAKPYDVTIRESRFGGPSGFDAVDVELGDDISVYGLLSLTATILQELGGTTSLADWKLGYCMSSYGYGNNKIMLIRHQ